MAPYRERFYQADEARRILADALARSTERGLPQSEMDRMLRELRVTPGMDGFVAARKREASVPKRIVVEETIEGELSLEQREDVLQLIRTARNEPGRIEVLGRTLTWTSTPRSMDFYRPVTVTLRVRDGHTRIRIEEELQLVQGLVALVSAACAVSSFLTFASIIQHHRAPLVVAAAIATVVIGLSCYFGARSTTRRYRREHEHLFESLRREIAPSQQRIARPVRVVADSRLLDEADGRAEDVMPSPEPSLPPRTMNAS
jgi:hypothetical protein